MKRSIDYKICESNINYFSRSSFFYNEPCKQYPTIGYFYPFFLILPTTDYFLPKIDSYKMNSWPLVLHNMVTC